MKRLSLCLLLAACGGSKSTTTTTNTTHVTAAPADPTRAARLAYSNPGGMWMPQQLALPGHVATFRALGVPLPATTLADPLATPLAAVVSLGGCTASFVSPEGLIVTNHHCVQTALQLNSTKDADLVEHGFLAATKADEPTAGPAQRVYVAQAFTDVTAKVVEGLDAIADAQARHDALEVRTKAIVHACEQDRPGLRCAVASYFRGGQYILTENLEIRDVRLVYVPARSIGNYGGEVDNWAWPRHTGDFSFFRAYVGKDGKPADFAPDNVPYRPAHFLKVSDQGMHVGDFAMVTGYPGSTTRNETAAETKFRVDWRLPYDIEHYQAVYAIAEAHVHDAGETGIKAAVMKQSVQNRLEKSQGVLKGLAGSDLLQRKSALDAKVTAWAAAPGHESYAAAIAKLATLNLETQAHARVDSERGGAFYGSRLLASAFSITRWSVERAKPDESRRPGFQDRDLPRALGGTKQLAKQYDATLDRAQFRLELTRALANPENGTWLAALLGTPKGKPVTEPVIDATLDRWYASSKLLDGELRVKLLTGGTAKSLVAVHDPFLDAVHRVWSMYLAAEAEDDVRSADALLVAPRYVDALRQVLGGELAPDANSTLRVTYGTVKPLHPGESAFTTAAQIPGKNTGKEPFDAPARELEAIAAKQYGSYADATLGGELPVDFVSDLDITNGNSGSPTLNGKGELVGLAFDGNIEGVASDVLFDGTTTRTITVDARYMLWVMDKLDNADHLLREMGITPRL